jgi:pseudouridine-5'-phosphate glycosidase
MFPRIKKITSGRKTYEYLQIVETVRESGKVRQKVLVTLGKMEELLPSGQLDRLAETGKVYRVSSGDQSPSRGFPLC